mmetsp:Transcript_2552/g.4373  ORF Transcript_2552/g.4373 Transcript_2552/m.4373 type:complete len:89 (+) Transcript_2552:72-338(+)
MFACSHTCGGGPCSVADQHSDVTVDPFLLRSGTECSLDYYLPQSAEEECVSGGLEDPLLGGLALPSIRSGDRIPNMRFGSIDSGVSTN